MTPATDTVEQLPNGGWQVTHHVTSTVDRFAGHNVGLAEMVYGWLGAEPPKQFYSIAFKGADDACRVFFLTQDVRRRSCAFLIDHDEGGLRLSRIMLWSLYAAVFTSGAASEIVATARRDDRTRRATLQRLGFRYVGVEFDPVGDAVLYALRPADLPDLYRRALARRQH